MIEAYRVSYMIHVSIYYDELSSEESETSKE